jgi:hypothetical protein
MKKLEEIEKKDIFNTPEGYFDALPTIIQSRIAKKEESWMPSLIGGLKYALPVLALTISLLWFFKKDPKASPEEILASVNTVDIADYIQSMELNNDDFLDLIDYSTVNPDSLQFQDSFIIDEGVDLTDILIDYETEL